MTIQTFVSQNPIETVLLVLLALVLVFTLVVFFRQRKLFNTLAERAETSEKLLAQIDNKQDMAFHHARSDMERLFDHQVKSSESLVEKLAGNQIKLAESFQQFQSLVQTGFNQFSENLGEKVSANTVTQQKELFKFKEQLQTNILQLKERIELNQKESQELLHQQFRRGIKDVREELTMSLKNQQESFSKNMTSLTQSTDDRLKEISGQVEKRLTDGFEKTTKTFHDVLKRLALIDEAQKKITELSGSVVSLQEILADKRSRGAFGEVQLESLVSNVMPTSHYKFQYRFSNDKIVDCALFLPDPTGVIGVDAKFPLENYQKMMDMDASKPERESAHRAFVQDIKKHVKDISNKYIIDGETATGAVMFIPAEAVFAEIHAHHPDLVEFAQQSKVWMVSPTTMMALLTTASAVLKDEATRKQVHVIQDHLAKLSIEFGRFKDRWGKLNMHIDRLTKSAKEIDTTADKITKKFVQIEQVELIDDEDDEPIGIGHQQ
ncbi:MAG: DNA recombination protein RmuC [Kangiellaceae bacterium]|nr:DNA recombination protein RmuC [Kangiellaceae bacterium]